MEVREVDWHRLGETPERHHCPMHGRLEGDLAAPVFVQDHPGIDAQDHEQDLREAPRCPSVRRPASVSSHENRNEPGLWHVPRPPRLWKQEDGGQDQG